MDGINWGAYENFFEKALADEKNDSETLRAMINHDRWAPKDIATLR